MKSAHMPALLMLAATLACTLSGAPTPSATPEAPTATTAPSDTPAPSPTPELPPEVILIVEPGPGSRLITPIHLSGMADTTFEQHLGVRLLLDDGTALAQTSTIIASEMGTRGPFELDLAFSVTGDRQGFIQVFSASPRDGGVTHLASVGVTLAAAGPVDIRPAEAHPEDIYLQVPTVTTRVEGGIAHVEGYGRASFEQTLVIEVLDVDGNVVGSMAVLVNAPEMGMYGPFSADVPYVVAVEGPGRIVVRDISPAFGGDSHRTSVEITLAP